MLPSKHILSHSNHPTQHSPTHQYPCAPQPPPRRSAGNYLVQLEVVQLLLVLCSTQLFTPSARAFLGGHPFIEAIMQVSGARGLVTGEGGREGL